MLKLGDLELGAVPRIAVPLRDTTGDDVEEAIVAAGADLVELRIDQFLGHDTDHVLQQVRRFRRLPVLATIRRREEGGGWPGSERDRLALYEAVLPEVAAVDVELDAGICGEVCAVARAARKLCIVSHHDFEETPGDEALERVVRDGVAVGGDVVKVAARCGGREDLLRLAGVLVRHGDLPLIVIGMGASSGVSRVFFPALGSLICYAAWDVPSAPGQLSLGETRALFEKFYGKPEA